MIKIMNFKYERVGKIIIMKLYYGLTNYHLLCCILHKLVYNSKEKAIFVCSQGILKNRIEALKTSKIFNEIFYIEDTNIRDECFGILQENSSIETIKKVSTKFVTNYEKILPFNIEDFEDIYLAADHGVFGIYVLIKKYNFFYFEDGRGIYSNYDILDNLLRIKNPGLRVIASYYMAYGRSNLINKKFIAFDSQKSDCNFDNCIDFDINVLLDKISLEDRYKILTLFNFQKNKIKEKKKIAIALTQRFSTYKFLTHNECVLMYSLLCDLFANDCKVYLKPHPADQCNYTDVFKKEVVLDKEIPSELLRYAVETNFDVGICTFSSSINSLKRYIDKIYEVDESIINYQNNIFKFYVLCEIAKKINANIIFNDGGLENLFKKYYQINENLTYIINYSNKRKKADILVKNENFNGANYIVKINKVVRKYFTDIDSCNKNEYLYMQTFNTELISNLLNFKIDNKLKLSQIEITSWIEEIKYEYIKKQ